MSFLRGLGKVAASPFRIANVPFRAIEKGVAAACGEEDGPDYRVLSIALEAVAKGVEGAVGEIGGES